MNGSVAAIVAAAGVSRRMGSCKQLLDLAGETVLARCLGTLLKGGITDIVVVVGLQGETVAAEARRFPVQVTVNPDPAGDMASSVRVGRQALVASVSGVIVALCDFPLVLPSTIARLAAVHGADHTAILIPCHAGQKGHPTLFPLVVLDELAAGGTLRDLVRRDPQRIRLLAVDDPGILQDMDTPEDYLAVREEVAARSLIQNEDDQRQQRQIEE